MWNVSSSTSPAHEKSTIEARNTVREGEDPIVTLTSVLTTTVHPTWVITDAVTLAGILTAPTDSSTQPDAQTETTTADSQAEATRTTLPQPQTAPSEALSTILTTSASSSQQMQEPSATGAPSSDSPSKTYTWETTSVYWPASATTATASTFQTATSTAAFQSYSSSPLSTSTSMTSVIAGASTSSETSSAQSKSSHHKVGVIVGGTVGGAAFCAIGLLACFLFIRRRRRGGQHKRKNSRQSLLHDRHSISSFNDTHQRQYSQSSMNTIQEVSIPSAPAPVVPPPRNFSNPSNIRPNPALAASNQDLSLDRMYLREESPPGYTENFQYDVERSPVSPIIEISPPSRSVSNYSRCSWEGSGYLKFPQDYDLSVPNSRQASTYYPGESTFTLADTASPGSNVLDMAKTRDSTRSDPFDLEPSPRSPPKEPPLPPPSYWRFRF
ncbi:uncharacterized protein N7483_004820 [Penicillium malachiteum]|uniref:uncharacterized protein n=1 Tax=Penicillium malachiteum TaxID=1324776 RepID=UPI002549B1A3|nr:uncharacterized protein N7483_004820 [Penicillium malachiteum]KAJ5730312.1 hypothetical protein N7483_004820 [Penicillium malachiteum]